MTCCSLLGDALAPHLHRRRHLAASASWSSSFTSSSNLRTCWTCGRPANWRHRPRAARAPAPAPARPGCGSGCRRRPCSSDHLLTLSKSIWISADTKCLRSAMTTGFAHVRRGAQRVLDLRGRDVLAAGGNHDVLLAVDDAQFAAGRAVFPAGDVAGAERNPVGVDRLARRLVVLEVAAEDGGAADHDLAVSSELDLDAGIWPTNRAHRRRVARLDRRRAGGLGQTVGLMDRHGPGRGRT